ncbi:DUF4870 family protein [Salinicola avicenniae]|uniref:DUF4870 family protein n=1 Tax=Salinicola avicenniae TaxID=2916836 RepID=UPI0020731215|nr:MULTISPECIES: hypothetical protein [unclassified Salinicola]
MDNTESQTYPQPPEQTSEGDARAQAPMVNSSSMALIVYVLYLAGFLTGITAVIGLILAHVNKGEEQNPMLLSHYRFQIRTFWWGLLWMTLGMITSAIFIGFFVMAFWAIWTIYRCVKGLTRLNRGQPIG